MKLNFIILLTIISTFCYGQNSPKIGLVLSGGGAKGLAHIGVLKELEKQGIKADFIVGTSMGSLIGGLYACGYSAHQIEQIVLTRDWDFLFNDKIYRQQMSTNYKYKKALISVEMKDWAPSLPEGLSDGQNILTLLNILTRNYNYYTNFDSLPIPFRCVATNIETGKEKVFDEGILSDAMRASMSIPSIFTPYQIGSEIYIDGGVVNNFPSNVAKKMGADIIIGVDVGTTLYKKEEINSIVKILNQTLRFYNARNRERNKDLCDIYIRPNIEDISIMEFENIPSIIDRGSKAAIKQKSAIRNLNIQSSSTNDEHETCQYDENIRIQSVIIKSEAKEKFKRHAINKLVFGTLKIKPPCTISDRELCMKINQIYGSEFFVNVGMNFVTQDSSYILMLDVGEKKKTPLI